MATTSDNCNNYKQSYADAGGTWNAGKRGVKLFISHRRLKKEK